MKTLQQALESLLDSDFDVTDNDMVISRLRDWLRTVRGQRFSEASQKLISIMSPIPEIPPSKRRELSETNTTVSLHNVGGYSYINIVYRGKQPAFSHISLNWSVSPKPSITKGKNNLIDFSNKRRHPNNHCWALPAEAFDILYNSMQ